MDEENAQLRPSFYVLKLLISYLLLLQTINQTLLYTIINKALTESALCLYKEEDI